MPGELMDDSAGPCQHGSASVHSHLHRPSFKEVWMAKREFSLHVLDTDIENGMKMGYDPCWTLDLACSICRRIVRCYGTIWDYILGDFHLHP